MIRKAIQSDLLPLTELALKLWPGHDREELAAEFAQTIRREDAAFFLCVDGETAVGFAQCGLRRDYVEGTSSSPVGYLEGVFVEEAYRGQGIAKRLLAACEGWARERGCREFASDCELGNEGSLRFHLGTGFREANRIICFTKEL